MYGGGRRRILSKDYTLLRDDQDAGDIETGQQRNGASAWRLISLAKEQAFVSSMIRSDEGRICVSNPVY